MMKEIPDLLQGTLDLLSPQSASTWPDAWLWHLRADTPDVEGGSPSGAGSLYPALYRLEDRGWIESEWGVSENNRKARFIS
jgi:hypothetical protein